MYVKHIRPVGTETDPQPEGPHFSRPVILVVPVILQTKTVRRSPKSFRFLFPFKITTGINSRKPRKKLFMIFPRKNLCKIYAIENNLSLIVSVKIEIETSSSENLTSQMSNLKRYAGLKFSCHIYTYICTNRGFHVR